MLKDLLKSTISGTYERPPEEALKKADCIIAQAFGFRIEHGFKAPGPINETLAELAICAANEFGGLPIIAQGEIAAVLEQVGHPVKVKIDRHRKEGKYLDTAEVLEQTREAMRNLGLHRAVTLAHAHHIERVLAQARKVGIETIPYHDLPGFFDPESVQWWTRSKALWILRETAGLTFLKVSGKI